MSSPEAERLAASVDSGGGEEAGTKVGEAWNTMDTKSAGAGPKDLPASGRGSKGGGKDSGGASEGLVQGRKKSKAAGGDGGDDSDEDDGDGEDEFFDRPLWESRSGSPAERSAVRAMRAMERVYKRLYGDKLPPSEMLRTLCLASTLFFMIGGYWLMRSLKDPVLTALCGVEAIPKAKMLSVFIVLGVVSIYNHLLDSDIPKHKLFYLFGTFYFCMFTTIALLLMHPTIGLANQQPNPTRFLGWFSYCGIESFGSVMVSLFWSFANSNISLETAKASYGVMVASAQIGSIIGPTIVNRYAAVWGVARMYFVGAICMLLLQGAMWNFIRIYGASDGPEATAAAAAAAEKAGKPEKKKEKAGILEGLWLFAKYNYVKGIFAISCLFMVEVTIVDFTMKMLAKVYFSDEFPCKIGESCYDAVTGAHGMSTGATEAFTAFMGFFGQATNTLSFLLSLFGTSAVIRYLGLRLTLLLFPSLCLMVIVFVRLYPNLYVVFGAMMMLKANSYALNNPTKEILYQPTSPAVKYKAKSWIDIFGARGSKALGSLVTNAFSDNVHHLVQNGSLVGMAVASFLIWNATFMGRKFDEYTESGYVVGQDPSEESEEAKNIEMACNQNEDEDTSCAIYDDKEVGPEEEGQTDDASSSSGKKPEVQMV